YSRIPEWLVPEDDPWAVGMQPPLVHRHPCWARQTPERPAWLAVGRLDDLAQPSVARPDPAENGGAVLLHRARRAERRRPEARTGSALPAPERLRRGRARRLLRDHRGRDHHLREGR